MIVSPEVEELVGGQAVQQRRLMQAAAGGDHPPRGQGNADDYLVGCLRPVAPGGRGCQARARCPRAGRCGCAEQGGHRAHAESLRGRQARRAAGVPQQPEHEYASGQGVIKIGKAVLPANRCKQVSAAGTGMRSRMARGRTEEYSFALIRISPDLTRHVSRKVLRAACERRLHPGAGHLAGRLLLMGHLAWPARPVPDNK
jgi:hypothetical protein